MEKLVNMLKFFTCECACVLRRTENVCDLGVRLVGDTCLLLGIRVTEGNVWGLSKFQHAGARM